MRLNRKQIARVAAYSTLTPRSPLGVDNDVSHAARRLGEGQSVLLKPFQVQLDRLADQSADLFLGIARRHATRQVRHVSRQIRACVLNWACKTIIVTH